MPNMHSSVIWMEGDRERGSTMVEFALTISLFLVMLFGIIDFGRALYTYHFLSNAARTATRWAAVNGHTCSDDGSCNGTAPMNNGPASDTDVKNYVLSLVPPGINSTKINTTVCGTEAGSECPDSTPTDCATTPNGQGCTVRVTISYNFPFLVPLVRSASLPLTSTSEMVISH